MPICQNCGREWTWKQTIKTLFKLKCPHCGERQYETAASRWKNGMFTMIWLVIFTPIVSFLDVSMPGAVIVGSILILIQLGIHPFNLKLSNEFEPYW
ncbi:TIGR04104 family putative zinc finger protein [Lentibacillus sp. N15]|uniref:TIGR04104 family putative zinc finger protein n=1 Tax=Lentibacillus songyuanensis TaxID=3136161 RepID=UPI0031BA09A1